jgi:hypothetical protein
MLICFSAFFYVHGDIRGCKWVLVTHSPHPQHPGSFRDEGNSRPYYQRQENANKKASILVREIRCVQHEEIIKFK